MFHAAFVCLWSPTIPNMSNYNGSSFTDNKCGSFFQNTKSKSDKKSYKK
jgi:hypothetical protein